MTREERHALLGPEVLQHIDAIVDAAPEPTPEVVEALRRIFTAAQGVAPAETAPTPHAA